MPWIKDLLGIVIARRGKAHWPIIVTSGLFTLNISLANM
jgi:hypothetical protein